MLSQKKAAVSTLWNEIRISHSQSHCSRETEHPKQSSEGPWGLWTCSPRNSTNKLYPPSGLHHVGSVSLLLLSEPRIRTKAGSYFQIKKKIKLLGGNTWKCVIKGLLYSVCQRIIFVLLKYTFLQEDSLSILTHLNEYVTITNNNLTAR